MNQVNCQICGRKCVKNGKTKAGSQRWLCKHCAISFTQQIDNESKQLQIFLEWLFSKHTLAEMPGDGRTFRRKTAKFWDVWPMPPIIETHREVVFVDGIYLSRKACVLICCDTEYTLGWYLCRYEHSGAWKSLMKRIAEPVVVVSDGGSGFKKALKQTWPNAEHQRCLFHIFCQIKRYTTSRPKTLAGIELYELAKDLLKIKSKEESEEWTDQFREWLIKYNNFLSEVTVDEFGRRRPTHERLLKASKSIIRLLKENTMFTYLEEKLVADFEVPSTTNRIEGGINSRLREMLRNHRGLSIERRIKAIFWWCYMHSPNPLPLSEILKVMPTDQSIKDIYEKMNQRRRMDSSVPGWGDAIVWNEFHKPKEYITIWD